MNKNLLIFGKNSYIGNYLTNYATALGASVISSSSSDCNFLKPDQVYHFFSSLDGKYRSILFLAVVNKSEANSFQSFKNNLQMVKNLIDGCKSANIESLIYFSSVDVYGRKPALPITEQTTINPDSWYGLAKYVCEWMLMSSGEVTFPITILRLPGIYGRAYRDHSIIGRMVSSIQNEQRVIIQGDGRILRDYVYIDDVCRLALSLISLKYVGVLNVATGQSYSLLDIARVAGRVVHRTFEVVFKGDSDPARNFDLKFDNTRLRTLVPDFRFSDLDTGVRSYI